MLAKYKKIIKNKKNVNMQRWKKTLKDFNLKFFFFTFLNYRIFLS